MTPQRTRHMFVAASLLAAVSTLSAQEVFFNWDGNGDPNASGAWVTGENWVGDSAPGDTANHVAELVDVTSGTRTITISNGETATAKRLSFKQSTEGGSNILSIASGGTLELGGAQTWDAPTGGTARVDLGGTINFTRLSSGAVTVNTDLTFTNAGAVFKSTNSSAAPVFNFNGAVNVNAGAGVARIAYEGGNRAITANFGATSTLSIDTGTLEVTTLLYNNTPGTTVTLGGTTAIAAGAGLKLSTDSAGNGGGGSSGVVLNNSGALTQAGAITTSGRGSGGATTLTNSGTWKVSGLGAVIQKETRTATGANPKFVNTSTGVFTGATASDRIDYNHLQTAGTDIEFTNSGVIAAGDGSNGSGLTSVGTLTLVDFAVTNTTGASLVFDVGGTGAGQFDVLAFESGSIDFTNASLVINLVNGFSPDASFALEIFTSNVPASVTGSFTDVTVNGVADARYTFVYDNVTGVGMLTYNAIPEPSVYALAAGFAAAGLAVRRRSGTRSSL